MLQSTTTTRTVTQKEWDKFIPAGKLAAHLEHLAETLRNLPPNMRGKLSIKMELAQPVEKA